MGKESSFKEKVVELWEDSKLYSIYEKIDQAFYDIKRGVKNLIIWFPVIWEDRDWDHWYLYKIIHKKLERMEILHRTYGHHVDNDKTADQIKLCKLLLKRLIADDYLMNATKYHDQKWGDLEIFTEEIEGRSNCVSVHTKTTKDLTEKEKKIEDELRHGLYRHADKMKEQDLDMLFRIMRKHIQGWWD